MPEAKSYESICHELGFIPETHFVRVTRSGKISYTAGKPSEIKALRKACAEKGYEMSKALRDFR